MKKKLCAILCSINLLIAPAFAIVQDDLVEKNLDKNLKCRVYKQNIIEDNLVGGLDKNLKIKTYSTQIVTDTFAESNKSKPSVKTAKPVVNEVLPKLNAQKLVKTNPDLIDYSSDNSLKIRLLNNISTRSKVDEGEYIDFETVQDIKIGNKIYQKGTPVKGRVETISMNQCMGEPANLIIGSFQIDGKPLRGELKKVGANRSLWVAPCVYVGTVFFFVGLAFIPIRGGHAKFNNKEMFTVYF